MSALNEVSIVIVMYRKPRLESNCFNMLNYKIWQSLSNQSSLVGPKMMRVVTTNVTNDFTMLISLPAGNQSSLVIRER